MPRCTDAKPIPLYGVEAAARAVMMTFTCRPLRGQNSLRDRGFLVD
jgi:hypothetical protein